VCFLQKIRPQAWIQDQHNLTPDMEGTDAYADLIRMAVEKDPSLASLAEQHLSVSSLPRSGNVAQPPPAPNQSKAPWLRHACRIDCNLVVAVANPCDVIFTLVSAAGKCIVVLYTDTAIIMAWHCRW
jgi:hypothetical protein